MHTQHPRVFSLHFVREVAGGWASGLSFLLLPLSAICSQASGLGGRPLQSKAPCFLSLLCAGDGPLLFRALPLDVGTDASHGHWLLDSAGCILAVVQGQGPRCATSAEAAALAGEPWSGSAGPQMAQQPLCREACAAGGKRRFASCQMAVPRGWWGHSSSLNKRSRERGRYRMK